MNRSQADIAMSSIRYVCEIQVNDDGGNCDIGSGWTGRITNLRE